MPTTEFRTQLFRHKFLRARRPSEKLMIVLHGRGDSIRPFYSFNDELGLPTMNYLLLNAPRKFMGGWSWYNDPPSLKNNVLELRGRIFELIAELEAQGWKAENIFLFGFSQGCLVSADVAMHFPRKLGGVVGISGYFEFFPRWRQNLSPRQLRTPWLFTHGRRDDVLSFETTRFGARKLKQAGFDVKFAEFDKDHVLLEEEYPLIRSWLREKLAK